MRRAAVLLIGGVVLQVIQLDKRIRHVLDHLIGIEGVVGGTDLLLFLGAERLGVILDIVAETGIAVGKDNLLVFRGLVLLAADLVLIEHGLEDRQLAIAVVLARPVAEQGVIHGGVIRDADQARALGERQIGGVLAEIRLRRGLHAVAHLAEVDRVEIDLEDVVLAVLLFKSERPVDLHDLTLDVVLVVTGDVLDGLLRDGRAALHAAAGQGADNGAHGTVPVHAVVALEALVLDGNGRLLQVIGDLAEVDPDAVLLIIERLVHVPVLILPGSGVLVIVHLRGDGGLILAHRHLNRTLHRLVDVVHEDSDENRDREHAHQTDRPDDAPDLSACGPLLGRGLGRFCLPFPAGYVFGALLQLLPEAPALSLMVWLFHDRAPSFLWYFQGRKVFSRIPQSAQYTSIKVILPYLSTS